LKLVETGLLGWLDRNYEGSLTKALQAVYPDHKWEPWQFAKVEDGFWDSIENQREFLASLHTPLGIFELAQWYRVTAHELKANGGRGLLQRYNGSMRDMLLATYPRHPWQEWRFLYKTTGNDTPVEAEDTRRHHLQGFMDNLAVKLSLKELDDWYRVSQKEVRRNKLISNLNLHFNHRFYLCSFRPLGPVTSWLVSVACCLP
jgi:hypothetical protein